MRAYVLYQAGPYDHSLLTLTATPIEYIIEHSFADYECLRFVFDVGTDIDGFLYTTYEELKNPVKTKRSPKVTDFVEYVNDYCFRLVSKPEGGGIRLIIGFKKDALNASTSEDELRQAAFNELEDIILKMNQLCDNSFDDIVSVAKRYLLLLHFRGYADFFVKEPPDAD